ncbi:MAG: hypothetical protein NUV77_26360, partial [Thermoguttaceae bacterium]|nr:hypothetical protein [Thermoguttaceae bacterium]
NAQEGFMVSFWQFGNASADAAIQRDPTDPINAQIQTYGYLNVLKGPNWPADLYNANRNGYEFAFGDVTDTPGFQGKGPNDNPASIFYNHQFCQFTIGTTTIWFDPSYGCYYSGATQEARELDFDDGSVAGYFVTNTANVREWVIGVDLNGNGVTTDVVQRIVMLIRPNAIGMREMARAM